MIGIVATLRIQPAKTAEFEALMLGLAAKVKANEPGCLFYELTKSRAEPNTYKVLEGYRDQAAVDQHSSSEYFRATMGAMRECFAEKPVIELCDSVE
jgi:quinol monooxygenase YgiN